MRLWKSFSRVVTYGTVGLWSKIGCSCGYCDILVEKGSTEHCVYFGIKQHQQVRASKSVELSEAIRPAGVQLAANWVNWK
jgi:hypothetical protein